MAQDQTERLTRKVFALGVSTLGPESLPCLVLEMWASEILDLLPPDEKAEFVSSLDHIDWSADRAEDLCDWILKDDFKLAFFKTWLLLSESLPLESLAGPQTTPPPKGHDANGVAVATRHWYKTACDNQRCPITGELSLAVRLPGHFSIRGDWFLAVAAGSRSERLGRRALDLLSSRRANFRRMELGIGLPTRDISSPDQFHKLPTACLLYTSRCV